VPIAGLIEVRGIGIVRLDPLEEAPLALIVDLVAPESLERLPLPCREDILGISLPVLRLAPFESSATAKLRLALRALTGSGPPHMVT
jgi:HPr kinase/phosphorylase